VKLTTNKDSGRVYARLKTGDPAKPYVRMTLGTKSIEEARRLAKDAKLTQIESALQAGALSKSAIARLTVGRKLSTEQAFDQFLAKVAKRGRSESTVAKNKAVGAQWFAWSPGIRSLPPMALTEEHVWEFINRSDEEAGYATRQRQLSVLRTFLEYCTDTGLTSGNVAGRSRGAIDHRALSHAQREPKQVQPFTAAEVRRILDNTEGWWRWATGISYAAGLRLGDIATLEHASLSVPGHIVVHTDKRDRRVCLPINERVTPGLAALLSEIMPTDSPYLFPEEAEQYADITSGRPKLSVQFGRLLHSLGIEGRSFHSLRHTAITRWKRIGFSTDQCAVFAGHSNPDVTEGYIHD